jgi:hypothetical protein
MATLALLITLLLNGGAVAPATVEDAPIVPIMGQVAIAALIEAHPECADGPTDWDFNVDASGGVTVNGLARDCEAAGQFYLAPDSTVWTFAVEGA